MVFSLRGIEPWIKFMSSHPRYTAVLVVAFGVMFALVWTTLDGQPPAWLTGCGPTLPTRSPAP